MPKAAAITVRATCASCDCAVDLECEGVSGPAGYETFNEFFCPRCRKQNHARTPGAILNASISRWEGEGGAVTPDSE